MLFEILNNNFNKFSKGMTLIHNYTQFITKKEFTIDEINILFFQCSIIFDKIINKLSQSQLENIIQNLMQNKKKVNKLNFFRIIYHINDCEKFYNIINTIINSYYDILLNKYTTGRIYRIIPIIFKNQLYNSIINNKLDCFINILDLINTIYNHIKEKCKSFTTNKYKLYKMKNMIKKIIGELSILCSKHNTIDYLIAIYKCSIPSIFTLNIINKILLINKNYFYQLCKTNPKLIKLLNTYKYKLYHHYHNTKLVEFITEKPNDSFILLSYNETTINNYCKTLTKETVKLIDWSFIYKHTLLENKEKLILLLHKISIQFPKIPIIYNFAMNEKSSCKFIKQLIDFTITQNLPFNIDAFIIQLINKNKQIIQYSKYLCKMKSIDFSIFNKKINSLLDSCELIVNGHLSETLHGDYFKIHDTFYKPIKYIKCLSSILFKNNIIVTISNQEDFKILMKRIINICKTYVNIDLSCIRILTRFIKHLFVNFSLLEKVIKNCYCDVIDPNNNNCLICFDKITKDTGCQLQCKHVYHKECFLSYLKTTENKLNCPYCTQSIFI